MKGPWDPPENSGDLIAYKEFREYRALNRRYHRNVRRQRLLRQLGLPMLALVGSFTVISGFLLFGPVQWPSFRSSPSLAQARSYSPFRTCADARDWGGSDLPRAARLYPSP
jgi:hypothetical protein